jgi:lipopolysaccharide/colanic/teichoic acid biosynthesis glycosyltransferase
MRAQQKTRQCGWRLVIKVAFDKLCALVLLVVLAPLLLVLGMIVWAVMGWPVFYCQVRPGHHGRLFKLFKFRTMKPISDVRMELATDAQRLTRFGKWLRATSLDELPELWNVLRGELSLVGPRPLLVQYLNRYSAEQARRHDVVPGITGWAQVNGRNNLSWEKKFELDVWYVEHWSLWLDMNILLRTLAAVASRKGITLAGHATTAEFMGSEQASGRSN